MRFEKWGIAIWLAAAQLLVSTVLIGSLGVSGETVGLWVRVTAWMSATLFLSAFAARPLRQFWKSDGSRWLLRNRRYVGVSGAFAHLIHGIGIVWLLNVFSEGPPTEAITLIGGGLGFVFYFAMALTSSDAAVARMGPANWKRLHSVGGYYVWAIFAFTFVSGASAGNVISILFLIDCFAVLALRLAARSAKRAPAAA